MDSIDPTYGYTLEQLLQVGPAPVPPDYEAFWRATYDEVLSIPLNISRRQIASPRADQELWEVGYNSLQGIRIGGWIIVPKGGDFSRGVVEGHGYGGRSEPGFNLPGPPAVIIQPCARGFHRSAHPDIPDTGGKHVLHGIEHRETYSHRGSVADFWLAASVLLELYPQVADNLHYSAASFGGGIGAMLLPWDKRIKKAFLDVPSFGPHPLRVTLPCQGSGEPVRLLYQTSPEILDVLAYFDSTVAATFTRIPVLCACALADPVVPPPGQFAVYNSLAGPKGLFIKKTGHPDDPEDEAPLRARLNEWFA